MNKIVEEILTSMIKRIEVLEGKQNTPKKYKFGEATPNQLKYIKQLGGETWTEMTKKEAGQEIDRLKPTKQEKMPKQPEPEPTSKPLSKTEIEEIGDGLL